MRTTARSHRVAGLMALIFAVTGAASLAVSPVSAAPIDQTPPDIADWQTITHDRLGFELSYPASVFQPSPTVVSDVGRVLVSRDGLAKLLIAAFDNESGATLEDYRQHVLANSYATAVIDYAPVRRSWFVLSGIRNDTIFYERVSFTCDGRRITSWAMLYPHAQRRYYNRILEAVARTFRPSGRDQEGC